MAVYDRVYRGYAGALRPAESRFLVLARYALQDVFGSRLFLGFFLLCFAWPAACGVLIYLHYNFEALEVLGIPIAELLRIDARFFASYFLAPQLGFAFWLVLIVGPALISPDLRNNALPLYLSRPVDRTDYVLGKLLVLGLLTSAITWVPGALLFVLQGYLAGEGWLLQNLRIGVGLLVGSGVWILALSLLALAISSLVKWKPWARVFFLSLLFVGSAVGTVFREVLRDWRGSFFALWDSQEVVLAQLFGIETELAMPAWAGWSSFLTLSILSVLLLYRRIRAFEVVR
jgi:ABC-2 type transport system permease protein